MNRISSFLKTFIISVIAAPVVIPMGIAAGFSAVHITGCIPGMDLGAIAGQVGQTAGGIHRQQVAADERAAAEARLAILGGAVLWGLGNKAAAAAGEAKDAVLDSLRETGNALGLESELSADKRARLAKDEATRKAAQVGSPERAAELRSAQETMAREGYVSYMVKLWGDYDNALEHEARQSVLSPQALSDMVKDPRTGEAQRVALIAYSNGQRLPQPSGLMEPAMSRGEAQGLTMENR